MVLDRKHKNIIIFMLFILFKFFYVMKLDNFKNFIKEKEIPIAITITGIITAITFYIVNPPNLNKNENIKKIERLNNLLKAIQFNIKK